MITESAGIVMTGRESTRIILFLRPVRYLLEPLGALDSEVQQKQHQPLVVVVLLDALDEACDGNTGFEAVAALIARE